MLGVSNPSSGSLSIRKTRDRGLVVEGSAPGVHTFPGKWLERELNVAVRVRFVILAEVGEYVYEASALEGADWVAQLVSVPEPPAPEGPVKRKWFRRTRRG